MLNAWCSTNSCTSLGLGWICRNCPWKLRRKAFWLHTRGRRLHCSNCFLNCKRGLHGWRNWLLQRRSGVVFAMQLEYVFYCNPDAVTVPHCTKFQVILFISGQCLLYCLCSLCFMSTLQYRIVFYAVQYSSMVHTPCRVAKWTNMFARLH